MQFASKGQTLLNLQEKLTCGAVPKLKVFSVSDWRQNQTRLREEIKKTFGSENLIVRSSCHSEDNLQSSNAGAFLSVPDVRVQNLAPAVERVIASYASPKDWDEIIVQKMIDAVCFSGVIFSHDPNNGTPYRVINWHEGSDTSFVTSGKGGQLFYSAATASIDEQGQFSGVLKLVEELLELFNEIPIDCEFAVSGPPSNRQIWLLQVRPLVINVEKQQEHEQAKSLNELQSWLTHAMGKHPFLLGDRTLYGVMPDWNPAEIIGLRPYPLALSLYKELITDSIWAYQRHNYGYRNLRSFPLMSAFHGLPYIDVRVSFNSFIPSELNENTANKLVNYYLDKLSRHPQLHDKVEFDIVFSCFNVDLPKRLEELRPFGFDKTEIAEISGCLLELTNNIIDVENGLWLSDQEKLRMLPKRRKKLLSSDTNLIEKIYWLLEDGKRYGTLPFAGLARAGFVAVQMIQSFVSVGLLSQEQAEQFYSSLMTVSKELAIDKNLLPKKDFLKKYGHLRPGTYEITSPRYDVEPDVYFDWSKTADVEHSKQFSLRKNQEKHIDKTLMNLGLKADAKSIFHFCKNAIELREFAKFEFTKNLSLALNMIEQVGEELNLSRDEIKYSNIKTFYLQKQQPKSFLSCLKQDVKNGKKKHLTTLRTTLPSLIKDPNDVWFFSVAETVPNFITQKKITAELCSGENMQNLEGRVILIPNADPGFDWLFSHKIAGLITAWGGANSHMAIRAGELGLPAVVGVGEHSFANLRKAFSVSIDCATKSVSVVQ